MCSCISPSAPHRYWLRLCFAEKCEQEEEEQEEGEWKEQDKGVYIYPSVESHIKENIGKEMRERNHRAYLLREDAWAYSTIYI